MITVEGLLKTINSKSNRLRVFIDGKQEFIGYSYKLTDYSPEQWKEWKDKEVLKLRCKLDIKHKEWKERGLLAPLEPDITPTYQFSDLQTELYYEIYL